ncbi:MAG: GNAT family N-acetyltransferase [Peptococcaceae bacterium]|nr:GNAT family N-acetyltransferase [Peptococcaceae bacterium]
MPDSRCMVEGPVSGDTLLTLKMHDQLNNFRPPGEQIKALVRIARSSMGRVYIARSGEEIVGYITFHRPDEFSRWHRLPFVLELGGVEVARDWRRRKVGSRLLDYIFRDGYWEDFIVISTEYFRHWDTGGNRLDVWEYRNMLDRFFGRAGFMPMPTNDPDILEHPANVLMARVGSRVGWEEMMRFDDLAAGRL